jgi:hypothetical protein
MLFTLFYVLQEQKTKAAEERKRIEEETRQRTAAVEMVAAGEDKPEASAAISEEVVVEPETEVVNGDDSLIPIRVPINIPLSEQTREQVHANYMNGSSAVFDVAVVLERMDTSINISPGQSNL